MDGREGGVVIGIPLLQLTANCLTRMKREKPPGKTVSIVSAKDTTTQKVTIHLVNTVIKK